MSKIKRAAKLAKVCCVVLLAGCSSTKSLDCKPGKDMGCMSISQVNKKVNSRDFEDVVNNIDGAKAEDRKSEQRVKFGITKLNSKADTGKNIVERVPEETMRVWVNSFTDDKGDFVKETYIHTIIKDGYWVEK